MHAMSSYHRTLNIKYVTFVNFGYQNRTADYANGNNITATATNDYNMFEGGGAQRTYDLYLNPISVGLVRDIGNKYAGSHPGYRSVGRGGASTPQGALDNRNYTTAIPDQRGVNASNDFRFWNISGSEWDPYGVWTGSADASGNWVNGPTDKYLYQDSPFHTYGATGLTAVLPAGDGQGYYSSDKAYGISGVSNDYEDVGTFGGWQQEFHAEVLNASLVTQGTWAVNAAHTNAPPYTSSSTSRFGFRHCCFRTGQIYKFTFPERPSANTTRVKISVRNFYRAADTFIVGFAWSNSVAARGMMKTDLGNTDIPTAIAVGYGTAAGSAYAGTVMASFAALQAATGKPLFIYQDTTNNMVWLKATGGYLIYNTAYGNAPVTDPTSDEAYWQSGTIELVPGP